MITRLNHKSTLSSIYNHGNDYFYDLSVNTESILNDILTEINNNKTINTKKPLLYCIRFWSRYDNKYFFKIGYTENLYKRLMGLNNQFESYYRIIIISCANIDNINIEKDIHNILRPKYGNCKFGKSIKNKSTETYKTSYEIYDNFIKILDDMKLNYFKSNNYIYNDEDKIEYIYDKKYLSSIIKLNNKNIYLDQNINENRYWLKKYNTFLNKKMTTDDDNNKDKDNKDDNNKDKDNKDDDSSDDDNKDDDSSDEDFIPDYDEDDEEDDKSCDDKKNKKK